MKLHQRDPEKLYPHDRIMAAVILPFIPKKVHPKHITVLRFLLTPFAVWGIAIEAYAWAIPFFIFVAFTDVIDGSLARVRKRVTEWGTVFDPIADKVLISLAAVIVVTSAVGWWLTLALIFFELAIVMGGVSKKHEGKIVTANYWGKSKMFAQSLGVVLLMLSLSLTLPILTTIGMIVLILAIVLAVMSLLTYSL
ncbi:MAG TPA: CDP-alcohol phosphatidyltransferase family protein [Patescibacteria group bacterium]|nr:CDP-alcohol phosphatidyltransferase family protein [Patescibacteria group bacterium]